MPFTLKNLKTDQDIVVRNPAEAQQLLATGDFGLFPQKDGTIPVIAPDGRPGVLDGDRIFEALKAGFSLEPPESRAARIKRLELDNQNMVAAGEALADGLTLSASTALLDGLGFDTKERLEVNDKIAAVGSITGAVIPAFLSGGGSLGARGAVEGAKAGTKKLLAKRVLGATPAGLLDDVGRAAETAIAQRFATAQANPGLGKAVLEGATKLSGRGAVEGSIFAASEQISDAFMNNEDLTLEAIYTAVRGGGLFGAAGGGVLGGIGGAASNLIPKALNKALVAAKSTGKTYSKVSDVVNGLPAGTTESLPGLLAKVDRVDLDQLATDMTAKIRNTNDVQKKVTTTVDSLSPTRKATFGKVIDDAVDSGELTFESMFAKGQDEVVRMKDLIAADLKRVDIDDAHRRFLVRIDKKINGAIPRLTKAEDAKNYFFGLDQLKQDVNAIIVKPLQSSDEATKALGQILDDSIGKSVRGILENRQIVGPVAALQARLNGAINRKAKADKLLRGLFETKKLDLGISRDKVMSFIKKGDTDKLQIFDQWVTRTDEFLNEVNDIFKMLPDASSRGSGELFDGIKQMRHEVDELHAARKVLEDTKRSSIGGKLPVGQTVRGLGAAAVFGLDPSTIALGAVAEALANPISAARSLNAAREIVKQVDNKIGATVRGFGKRAAGKARTAGRVARRASFKLLADSSLARDKDGRKPKTESIALNNIRSAVGSGGVLQATAAMEPFTTELSKVSPHQSQMMINKEIASRQLIAEELPPPSTDPFEQDLEMSDAEKRPMLEKLEIADDPKVIFDFMADGTMTRDHVDTFKTIAPLLHDHVSELLMVRIAEDGPKIPYNGAGGRLQMCVWFGQPIESSCAPQFIRDMQANVTRAQSEEQLSGRPGDGRAEHVTLAERTQTQAEKNLVA